MLPDGFAADLPRLPELAREVGRIRASLALLTPAAQLRAAAGAVPGGRLAAAAGEAADRWERALAVAAGELEAISAALRASGASYGDAEAAATARFQALGPRADLAGLLPGPRGTVALDLD